MTPPTPAASEAVLLPCPWCGEVPFAPGKHVRGPDARFDTWWTISCSNDDCPVEPNTPDHDTSEEAIAAWNTRPPAATADLAALGDDIAKAAVDLSAAVDAMWNDRHAERPGAMHEKRICAAQAQLQAALAASAAGDVRAFEAGAEQREAWTYLWRWVERGYFDKTSGSKTAIDVMLFHPSAPWNSGEWDVTHKPYAEQFYAKFPKARPKRATTTEGET